jgi:hypothetical protein
VVRPYVDSKTPFLLRQEGARREGSRKVPKTIDRLLGDRLEEIGFAYHNIVYDVSLDVSCYITHDWTSEQQRNFARYLNSVLQHGSTENFQGLVIQPECTVLQLLDVYIA